LVIIYRILWYFVKCTYMKGITGAISVCDFNLVNILPSMLFVSQSSGIR
jgi:hypothetical protein